MQNIGDYHDLYLRTDVLLLADIFETFQNTSLQEYGLDPAHYYTSPGLSWHALLKKTGVELELLTYYNMHLFIEKGLRGGTCALPKRYAKTNNPMVEGFDRSKPPTWITYLDANNLYGWAMSQPLPTDGFEWVKDTEELEEVGAAAAERQWELEPSERQRWEQLPRKMLLSRFPQPEWRWATSLKSIWSTRGAAQRTQCLPTGTRAHGGQEGVDV